MLPTNSRTYKSVDVVMDPSQALLYPVEFLHSLEPQAFLHVTYSYKSGYQSCYFET
jgi:hypothetical protein